MRKNILTLIFIAIGSMLFAQQKKQLTLEELIPGGKFFSQFSPHISNQYQWYGNKLISIHNDSVFLIKKIENPHKETLFFTYDELKEKDRNVYAVLFPEKGNLLKIFTPKGIGLYDLTAKHYLTFFAYPANGSNYCFSPQNKYEAYTKDNNLYIQDQNGKETAITTETNPGIVYGQAVHRNEFGIKSGIFWSPDDEKLAFYRMDETMVTDYPLVNISTRVASLKNIKYPMAGMASHQVTVGIYNVKTGQTVYLKTGEPKDRYLTNIAWSPDGKFIYIAELNRQQNHMKMNRYDALSGEFDKTLFEETHPKYVEPENPVLFVKNKPSQFIWQSRRNGYNHLYLYDISGKLLKQFTDGKWEVTNVIGFDEKGENLYFLSTNPSPIDRHIYSLNIQNGKTTQLSTEEGVHDALLCASGRYLIDEFSSHNNPGKSIVTDTHSKKSYPLALAKNPYKDFVVPSVESGTLKAADNKTDLYYRLIKPIDFDPSKKYPVAVYLYGGPHSQMVQNRWRYSSRGWETYMAQKGYLVFVMDNRGTSYRGLDFENVTHRHLGVEESKDQMRGVEFLKSLPYVDATRMGIHGWSFGGFMTITMLLRYPDVFKVGVAGGPVIDWKYYEIMYGERYMDTPQENPQGYAEASLLNKADKLKSRLLIIQGDEDHTVVMQNCLQFLKSCIHAGTHPDLFIYPGHKHNVMGHDRVHLHEHITRYFEDFCK